MKKLTFAFVLIAMVISSCLAAENTTKKDDVVTRICKSNPTYTFCKQYMDGEMGEASMIPFPHGHKHMESESKEGKSAEKRLLIIENEFYPNGTVKIPPNVTLDASNEAELAAIKKKTVLPFRIPKTILPARDAVKTDKELEASSSSSSEETSNEKENFNFELPYPEPPIEFPSKLPDHRVVPEMKDGLLKDIGVNVGFGLGVNAVKDNDPVRVATNVGVSLGESGRAGGIPFFFPGQGEEYSLNDYDGNKRNIVPDRARKYYIEQGGSV
uniref:DUF4774 domain-containing protein n=1 Tax=Panagrellus redivivus TaxID=6233 RepID=A0A7E4V5G6_PANRE